MIYTPLTKAAMQIAYRAHCGRVDKSGIPYIFHPIHLAEQMEDEYSTCVALLHDVVEDTEISIEELVTVFPKEVIDAVKLLTHTADTDYFTYVAAIKSNPIAKAVKLADLAHNSDESRMAGIEASKESISRCRTKYQKALEILK